MARRQAGTEASTSTTGASLVYFVEIDDGVRKQIGEIHSADWPVLQRASVRDAVEQGVTARNAGGICGAAQQVSSRIANANVDQPRLRRHGHRCDVQDDF